MPGTAAVDHARVARDGRQPDCRTLPRASWRHCIEPDGRGETAYLLTGNYKAILKYNCSNFYALSVGLLANAIVGDDAR
jgi:membrane-bound lytic murein transglycosylase B